METYISLIQSGSFSCGIIWTSATQRDWVANRVCLGRPYQIVETRACTVEALPTASLRLVDGWVRDARKMGAILALGMSAM